MIFRQNDPDWGSHPINGREDRPLGGYGCALSTIAQAAYLKGTPVTPLVLAQRTARAGGFLPGTATVIWGVSAAQVGLSMPAKEMRLVEKPLNEPKIRLLQKAVDGALARGWFCVLGVDHDKDKEPDHYLLAKVLEDGKYLCTDSATGKEVPIDRETLTAPAGWQGKTYLVLSAKPIG